MSTILTKLIEKAPKVTLYLLEINGKLLVAQNIFKMVFHTPTLDIEKKEIGSQGRSKLIYI